MKSPPEVKKIKKWLVKEDPLGLFRSGRFLIKDIDPKPWSGHFNYLVKINRKKFVLRFKGPEWGEPTKGILDEFKTLKFVEKHKVGPKVFYLTKNFFGEPAMLEEYLEGKIFNKLSQKEQEKIFSKIAKFIARINKIPINKKIIPFRKPMLSYEKNKKAWQRRLKDILKNKKTREAGLRIKKILSKAERMIDEFEPLLKRATKKHGPVFIFESAHAGHLLKTKDGFRFFNWEQVSFGDPSYTLAVFLASIQKRRDFEKIKKEMIKTYLKQSHTPDFEKLVEQRLKEREISNMIWRVWIKTQK